MDGKTIAWSRRLAIALVLLGILTAGIAFASGSPPPANDPNDVFGLQALFGDSKIVTCAGGSTASTFPNWLLISIVEIAAGILIVSFGYIMGGLLGTNQYNAFMKGTLWNMVECSVILGVFTASMIGLMEVGESNLDTARAYSTIIKNTAVSDFSMMLVTSTVMTFFAKQTPQLRIPGLEGLYLGFQMYPMFRPAFDALGMVTQLMTVSIVEWTAHEFLLCLIKGSMLTLLVPAGIFLRIFGIKNAGNALIGLALAMYFIYPWMMIMIGSALTDFFQQELVTDAAMQAGLQPGTQVPQPSADSTLPLCFDKVICCIGADPSPEGWDEPYLPSGPLNETSLQHRVSVKKVLEGGEVILPWGAGSEKSYCVFSTSMGKVYNWFINNNSLGSIFAGIVGAGIVSFIADFFNVSFVFLVMLHPSITFTIYAIYEAVFFLFVVSMVLPIFSIFITLTLAKEFAKLLGTEIEMSALEKIL